MRQLTETRVGAQGPEEAGGRPGPRPRHAERGEHGKWLITRNGRRWADTALTERIGGGRETSGSSPRPAPVHPALPTLSGDARRGQAHPPAASAGQGPPPDGLEDGPRRPPQ